MTLNFVTELRSERDGKLIETVETLLRNLRDEGVSVSLYEKEKSPLYALIIDFSEHDRRVVEKYERDKEVKSK